MIIPGRLLQQKKRMVPERWKLKQENLKERFFGHKILLCRLAKAIRYRNIRYLPNLEFFKENGSGSSIQGTQITVESVSTNEFMMNNIALKLQKCWTHKIAFKSYQKC